MPISLLFKSDPSFSVYFLMQPPSTTLTSEALLHLMSELCTLPLNCILFCPLIVSCIYIVLLNYILTFMSQEHVFSRCVCCRNRVVQRLNSVSTCLVLCPGELMWRKRMGASEGFRLGEKKKKKMVWVSWMVISTQDQRANYHCPLPPNHAHCWLPPPVHCILAFSSSLLKLACVTVVLGCWAGMWSTSCPWAHSLGDLQLRLEATPECELPGATVLWERSVTQSHPAWKCTSKQHKQSARGKPCKNARALRTKNNPRTMDGGTILVPQAEKADTECPPSCMKLPASESRGLEVSLPPCLLTRERQAHH